MTKTIAQLNSRISDLEAKLAAGQANEWPGAKARIEELERPDFRQMREMLRAMQAGELTVSRGVEILEMWWAGNWSDDMLPPVRQDLIEEDSMPVEIIDRLNEQLAASQARIANLVEALERIKLKAVSLADAQVIALEALAIPRDTTALEHERKRVALAIAELCDKSIAPWEQRRHGRTEVEDKVLDIVDAICAGDWRKYLEGGA